MAGRRLASKAEMLDHIRALRREAEHCYRRGDGQGGYILDGLANEAEDWMWHWEYEQASSLR
jgi:hypothetical protein